jgi:hypothetical protein
VPYQFNLRFHPLSCQCRDSYLSAVSALHWRLLSAPELEREVKNGCGVQQQIGNLRRTVQVQYIIGRHVGGADTN